MHEITTTIQPTTVPALPERPLRDRDVLFGRCQRFLSGHGRPRLADVLAELAQEAVCWPFSPSATPQACSWQ